MAWITTIEPNDAEGLLVRIYQAALQRAGRVYNILKVQSASPEALQACMELYLAVMRRESPLTRAQREMLAVVVSKANNCHY